MLGWSMAASTLLLSWRYRQPILTAWSTPEAALLIAGMHGHSLGEAVAAFMVCGLLTLVCGLTGAFAKLMSRVPRALASAMLAGVLLQFGLNAFSRGAQDYWIMTAALCVWLIGRRVAPRYAVLMMLGAGVLAALGENRLTLTGLAAGFPAPAAVMPVFSIGAVVGLGLPLFVVTMASQNAPGVAMLENERYAPPVSPILVVTGAMTLLLAPIGGFVTCLAAITAGICLTPEAHEDPARRYLATLAAGGAYVVAGVFGDSLAAVLQSLPGSLIAVLAGLALLPAIAGSLSSAMAVPRDRDAATLTFLATASGIYLGGIGAPFWGLAVGLVASTIWQAGRENGRAAEKS